MRAIVTAPLAAAAIWFLLSPRAHADVLNGSFETPVLGSGNICSNDTGAYPYTPCGHVPGWTGVFQLEDQNGPFSFPIPVPDGQQVLILQSLSGIIPTASQDILVPTANTYTLTFYDVNRTGNLQSYSVELDGGVLQTFAAPDTWTQESLQFSTTPGQHTLSFVGAPTVANDLSAGIDAVSIPGVTGLDFVSTPEPSSWLLFTTSAAALIGLRKRFC